MSTNNCNHDQPCGCNNDELTTLPDPCDTTNCTGEGCEQIINCDCVRYDGAPIPQIGVEAGDTLCDILSGLVGLGGVPGPQGIQGPQGLKGDDGDDGPQGEQGERGLRGLSGLQGFFPEIDSGWVNLLGFDFLNNSGGGIQTWPASGFNKPQVRRIGKTLHFRGLVVVPLGSNADSAVLEIPQPSSQVNSQIYLENLSANVYTGTGGCSVLVQNGTLTGAIAFNKNTRVIPSTVIPTTTNLDNGYTIRLIARRRIALRDHTNPDNVSGEVVTLNSYINAAISSEGKLIIATEKDVENTPSYPIDNAGNSMRFITSRIVEGQAAFKYNESYTASNRSYDTIGSISDNIDPSQGGLHSYPVTEVIKTTTGNVSNSATVPFANTTGIEVGMYFANNNLNGYISLTVDTVVIQVNPTSVVLSNTVTVPSGTSIRFRTGRAQLANSTLSIGVYGYSADTTQPDQIGGFYFPLDGLTAYLAPAVLASGFSTLSTGAKTNVSIAIIGGSISNLGGGTPYYKGICYFEGSVGNPTINDYYVLSTDPTPQVIGNITITGLLPATNYRFRSFVVTEAGTAYGTTITAITN